MNQEQLQLTGGNTIRKDRSDVDFYPTPSNATRALMDFLTCKSILPNHCNIWEPACGDLAMTKVMESYGHSVTSTDLRFGQDFLTFTPPNAFDAIITNPPFKLFNEFVERAISIAPTVIMLSKCQCWHGKKKAELFKNAPPAWILPLTWRVDFLNGAKGGRPTMDVQWNVWIYGNHNQRYQPLMKPE